MPTRPKRSPRPASAGADVDPQQQPESDSTEPWPYAEDATADFAYVRLHGSAAKYAGAYSDAALDQWHARLKAWSEGKPSADARLIAPQPRARERKPRDVYCYFDNDQKTEAPFDARRLMTRFGFAEGPLRRDAQAI